MAEVQRWPAMMRNPKISWRPVPGRPSSERSEIAQDVGRTVISTSRGCMDGRYLGPLRSFHGSSLSGTLALRGPVRVPAMARCVSAAARGRPAARSQDAVQEMERFNTRRVSGKCCRETVEDSEKLRAASARRSAMISSWTIAGSRHDRHQSSS